MRVCLVGLIAGGHSGVPRYAQALIRALDSVGEEFPRLDLQLLATEPVAAAIAAHTLDVTTVGTSRRYGGTSAGRILLEQVAVARQKADLLHYFDATGPVFMRGTPFITTVHDAASAHGFTYARKLQTLRRAYKQRIQPWALKHAAAVVADSEFGKAEAVRYFNADPSKIFVISPGPGLIDVAESSGPNGRVPRSPYVLFVGNLSANKNLPLLIRAFGRADVSQRLILVGRPGYRFDEVRAAMDASPAGDRIEVVEDVTDSEVDAFYRSATALVLPSLYEGFGFTALEAMTRGCPVLASDIPSIREISGDGALLLPPDDEAAWAAGLRAVSEQEDVRAELRTKGLRTASKYQWEATARNVCELFMSVGSKFLRTSD